MPSVLSLPSDLSRPIMALLKSAQSHGNLDHILKSIRALNLQWRSNPVLLFLLTIGSSSAIGSVYVLQKLLNRIKARRLAVRASSGNLKRGSRLLSVPYKDRQLQIVLPPMNSDKYESDKLIFKSFMKDQTSSKIEDDDNMKGNSSIMDSKFLKKLFIIWRLILIPKVMDKNTTLLLAQIVGLVLRTWLSLLVTKLDGQIVKDLIGLKGRKFARDLVYWFLFAVPASYTNAGIKYLTKRLALNFRTNLVRYAHDLYMDPRLVYYKLQFNQSQLAPEYQLDYRYIDQYLTEDINRFTETLSSLFSNTGKPFMDLIFFAFYLRDTLGTAGIMGIFFNYFLTGWFLRLRAPNFNSMLKKKTTLEGIFFNYNINLINNCEEISFYQGIVLEKLKIKSIFDSLLKQTTHESNQRFIYGFWEDYVLKYSWSGLGYLFASIPIVFAPQTKTVSSETKNMKQFIVNKRLMLSMADAGSRLMYSIKDLARLSGYTDRIFTMLLSLHQVHDNAFQYGLPSPQQAGSASGSANTGFGSSARLSSFASSRNLLMMRRQTSFMNSMANGIHGTIQKRYPGIRFEKTPLIIPSPKGVEGEHLLDGLNVKIGRYDNLLILGKNGSGKTSIMRLIAQLWPLYSGLLSKPSDADILYIPQKPYFYESGTLRDQIIYPMSMADMVERGVSDDQLVHYLEEVGLGYLFERFGRDLSFCPTKHAEETNIVVDGKSADANRSRAMSTSSSTSSDITGTSWKTLLSGGERQKLVMARILFHNKSFVVLDEPTSAISYDMEAQLFETLIKKRFTFITLSHRPLLMKYHDCCLELKESEDSNICSWEFRRLASRNKGNTTSSKSSNYDAIIEREIDELKTELAQTEEISTRKQQLIELLK
ncbi:unnamed protein product [Kuraishia capsulata CBS 1993]|uniref:ABC transporter domain-containing protein n=1 Tax=Kuraishia capsulata CBS 1993 TaxID=1382522 RepID=W6MI30_9ASCO|nr:uncharacterized protein KUCA_T00001736001 [Kuraishia capsulata CBS 1993]CDK25766.1 unnamed protein product [Kuraishia capsulata CBS 1993]